MVTDNNQQRLKKHKQMQFWSAYILLWGTNCTFFFQAQYLDAGCPDSLQSNCLGALFNHPFHNQHDAHTVSLQPQYDTAATSNVELGKN